MTAERLMRVGPPAPVAPRAAHTRAHTESIHRPDAIQTSEKGA